MYSTYLLATWFVKKQHLNQLLVWSVNTKRLFEGVIHLTYFGWLFQSEMSHTP